MAKAKTHFAHAVIEDPVTGARYRPGDELPADLPGLDDIVEAGSAGDKPPEPEAAAEGAPVPDGATHITSGDGADAGDVSA